MAKVKDNPTTTKSAAYEKTYRARERRSPILNPDRVTHSATTWRLNDDLRGLVQEWEDRITAAETAIQDAVNSFIGLNANREEEGRSPLPEPPADLQREIDRLKAIRDVTKAELTELRARFNARQKEANAQQQAKKSLPHLRLTGIIKLKGGRPWTVDGMRVIKKGKAFIIASGEPHAGLTVQQYVEREVLPHKERRAQQQREQEEQQQELIRNKAILPQL
jgi:hypothetical protein